MTNRFDAHRKRLLNNVTKRCEWTNLVLSQHCAKKCILKVEKYTISNSKQLNRVN